MTCAGKLQRGQTGSQKRLGGGSLKQDMHKMQTDLTGPRTVELTEQTPVVADHTVQKVSHGLPRCSDLTSVCPGDTLPAAPHCEATPGQTGGSGATSAAGKRRMSAAICIPGRRPTS